MLQLNVVGTSGWEEGYSLGDIGLEGCTTGAGAFSGGDRKNRYTLSEIHTELNMM